MARDWKYAGNIPLNFPAGTLLGKIARPCWEALNETWTATDFDHDQHILDADDSNNDVLFLLRGKARAKVFTQNGREVSFVNLDRGDCFGEFAAIDGAPRSASVTAIGECTVARMSASEFKGLVEKWPDLAFALCQILVGKLRNLTSRVADFNALNADERIRREILRLVETHQREGDSALVERPPTQAELAAFVFSNRETVAREVGRMRKAGVLSKSGRSIVVPSITRLRTYIESKRSKASV